VVTVLVDLGGGPVGQTVALVSAQEPEPTPDEGPEFGKASPIALVVIILLGIATLFLIRSMTKHLRRVPASFDPPETPAATSTEGEPPPER
jgi:ABC-type sugar transport system permease subunit